MQTRRIAVVLIAAWLLTGCATPTVVAVKQAGDANLSCAQMKDEFAQADNYLKAAKKERTVTGTNVAAAIFFLPGLLGTYVNTEEAINAAKDRQALLTKLAQKKNCDLNPETAESQPLVQASNDSSIQSPRNPAGQAPSQPAKAVQSFMPMTAMEIQKQLLALGYQVGAADGVMGKKSLDALKKFQKDNGLPSTGQADTETVTRLRQKAGNVSANQ